MYKYLNSYGIPCCYKDEQSGGGKVHADFNLFNFIFPSKTQTGVAPYM